MKEEQKEIVTKTQELRKKLEVTQ